MEQFGCFIAFVAIVFAIASFVALVLALGSRSRIEVLEREIASLRARLWAFERSAQPSAQHSAEAQPVVVPEPAPFATQEVPVPPPPPPQVEVAPPAVEEVPAIETVPAVETPTPPPHVGVPAAAAMQETPAPLPEIAAEFPAPPPKPSQQPAWKSIDWEGIVGVKLFSWIAAIALALAAIYFAKYSIDHGWLRPPIRMAMGLVAGAGLLVAAEWRLRASYGTTANSFSAAGIAILYSTLFASHALWHLMPQAAVFAAMLVVTAVAVALSVIRGSLFIALLGLLGGFATPALLSTGEDRPIALFGYLLLLNVGLAAVAYRKRWPVLSALTLVFTTIYQWSWVAKFLGESKLSLAAGIFVVFPIASMLSLFFGARSWSSSERQGFEKSAFGGALLPLFFALYSAAIPAYGARWTLLFGFLLVLAGGIAATAILLRNSMLQVSAALATVAVFVIWISRSYLPVAWPGIVGFIAAFVLLYLVAPFIADRLSRPFDAAGERASYAAPVLLFTFSALAAVEPRTASPLLLFVSLGVLLAACAYFAIVRGKGGVYFAGAFLTVIAEGVWSANHLAPERLVSALLVYGAFGALFIAVPSIARWRGRELTPRSGAAAVLVASVIVLFWISGGPVAPTALWGLGILLAIVNLGLFAESAQRSSRVLTVIGVVLSWAAIVTWWSNKAVVIDILPALAVVALFAIIVVAGNAVAESRRARNGETPAFGGIYLGLVAHVFLLFVAGEPKLALPGWPIFAVMFVLDLAFGVAAFYTRRLGAFAAAIMTSQVVVMTWISFVRVAPFGDVSLLLSAGIAALACAWFVLTLRVGSLRERLPSDKLAVVSAVALGLSQIMICFVAGEPGRSPFWILLLSGGAFAVTALVISAVSRLHVIALLSIFPAALALFTFRSWSANGSTWTQELVYAGVLFALFFAYPAVLRTKALGDRIPHMTAIGVSIAVFLFLKESIAHYGYANFIGALPIAEAVALLLLLLQLLRIEPAESRDNGRLAIVAGSALAYITAAIPLQLEKQWITVGWALEAAALAWLFTRIKHRGLLVWSALLAGAVFARLVLNPAVLSYHRRGAMPIVNWYLYSYLVCALAMFVATWFFRRTDDVLMNRFRLSSILPGAAIVMLYLLLNIEIADYYSTGTTLTFNFSGTLAEDLSYTVWWGIFAIGLLVAGIVWPRRATRIASIALLSVAIVKCFLHDLARLGGLYRVGSLVGLAVSLALVALMLQRFVFNTGEAASEDAQ